MGLLQAADMHVNEPINIGSHPRRHKKKKKKLPAATRKKLLNFYGGRDPSDERIKANLSKDFDPNQPRDPHTGQWIDIARNLVRTQRRLGKELDAQGKDSTSPIRGVMNNFRGSHKAVAYDKDGNITGAIDYTINRSMNQIELNDVRVLEQRKGIGQQLLREIAAQTKDLPRGDKYEMVVYSAVSSAVPWYMKTGADFNSWSHMGRWSAEKVKMLREGKMPPPGEMTIPQKDGSFKSFPLSDLDKYGELVQKNSRYRRHGYEHGGLGNPILGLVQKWDFDPHQPRDYRGRWTDMPGLGHAKAIGRRAGAGIAAEQHSRTPGGSGIKSLGVASAFDHATKTITVKPPRPNRGAKPTYDGFVADSKLIDRGRALYERNNGPKAITNARLKELFLDPSKITQQERVLIASSRSAKSIDGNSVIRGIPTSRGNRDLERYDLIGQLASKFAPGSGNRSEKREGLSEERRLKMNEKRQASGKVSSTEFS